jgi:hypothetical protein
MDATNEMGERQERAAKPNPFAVINTVRDMCKQRDALKLLMLTLATYCNGAGLCFPSNRTLAEATSRSDRSIRRMLRRLKTDGELEILEPGIGRDQKRFIRLTRYVIGKYETGQSCVRSKPDKIVSAEPGKAASGLNRTRSRGKTSQNNQREHPDNNQNTHTPRARRALGLSISQSDIDQIFEAYPRKEGTAVAKRAIAKALKKISAEKLLGKTKAFAEARGGHLEYCPSPAKWFNEERYNDDPATWPDRRVRRPLTDKDFEEGG